jgi:ribosomal protein S18 acetylase RimI-like enzyme
VLELTADRVRGAWASEETLILLVREAGSLERAAQGLVFRRAEGKDAARYASDVGTDSGTTFTRRLADDVTCFIVEDGRKILHASWVTTSAAWTREVQALLAPPPGDAYVYESFTRADARGRGIYPFALAGMVTELAARGIERVWVGVEASNEPSRRAIAKAGFEEGFQIRFSRRHGKLRLDRPRGPLADEGELFLLRG